MNIKNNIDSKKYLIGGSPEETMKGYEDFKLDVLKALDLEDNPKRDQLFEFAWDYGNSYGRNENYYYDVWEVAQDLAKLIK